MDNAKKIARGSTHNRSFRSYMHGLTIEKVGYPNLIFCSCIHLHALAAVKLMIMVTGLTEQKMSQKFHLLGYARNCAYSALRW